MFSNSVKVIVKKKKKKRSSPYTFRNKFQLTNTRTDTEKDWQMVVDVFELVT